MKDRFLEFIDRYSKSKNASQYALFYNFISLMSDEHFDFVIKELIEWADSDNFDNGFIWFHKSMRQTDFYDLGEKSGVVDQMFWNFIYGSDIPYTLFKHFIDDVR